MEKNVIKFKLADFLLGLVQGFSESETVGLPSDKTWKKVPLPYFTWLVLLKSWMPKGS